MLDEQVQAIQDRDNPYIQPKKGRVDIARSCLNPVRAAWKESERKRKEEAAAKARAEAEAAGDRAQVDLCDLALAAHETADAQGGDLIGPDGAIWTRTEAREACADAINAGQG